MSRIKSLPLLFGLILALASTALAPMAWADVRTTVVLKNGQRMTGTNLAFRLDKRNVVVRTSQSEEPQIPVDQVAYIDFGGTADPSNVNLSGSQEAVVLRDGAVLKGQIIELGHVDKGDQNSQYLVIIRTEGGDERRLNANQVSRVYFPGGAPSAGTSGGSAITAPGEATLTVSAQQQWTPANFVVRRGDRITIRASGEITIGGSNPRATPNGTNERHPNNPLTSEGTGALIGRIGNSRPFLIGSELVEFQAPAAGELFLGVNDSHLPDNQGSYEVRIQRVSGRAR
jgi:hypothetical protein